jgi:prepilin-type N-terminal cleavage/methylation domain-containing protein
MMRKWYGFTLMETMVVMGIIALLASIAIPKFLAWLPEFRLRNSVADIQSMIRSARLHAVKENKSVVVLFDPDANGKLDGNYLAFVDNMAGGESAWTREPASEPLIGAGRVAGGVYISTTQFRDHRFRFNPRGMLMDVNKRIVLKNNNNTTKNIQLYVSGVSKVK